jgi:predicted metal-dependent peptidase
MSTLSKDSFAKIRINFLFNHPFLSVLALSIPTTFEANANAPFETNGSVLSIDMDKLEYYSEAEITYLYAHTLLHIVLKHPSRAKMRDRLIWNQASDIVVNNVLSDFKNVGSMPDDELIDKELKDKCVEEVYEILYKEEEGSQGEESKEEEEAKTTPDPKGKHKAYEYNPNKRDIQEVADPNSESGDQEKLDGIIIQALSIAKKNATLYEGLAIEINTLIKPEIDLHDILKEYLISSFFEKSHTYDRPNRRFIHQNLYLPGYKPTDELIELYIALDSSSSVTLDEYKKFLGIVEEVCEGFYEYKITVIPFDKRVKNEAIITFDSFNPIDEGKLLIPKSDGGTNFNEVLRYLKLTDIRAQNLLMVLSDGEFNITEAMVSQTLFVISQSKNMAKFESYGRVIEFNI